MDSPRSSPALSALTSLGERLRNTRAAASAKLREMEVGVEPMLGPFWLRQLVGWALVLAAIAMVYGDAFSSHMLRSAHPALLNDDARQQVYPFFRYTDSSLIANDYIADYYLANLPIGYKLLYIIAAKVWDPVPFSKALVYMLMAVTAAGVGLTANRFGGKLAAWASVSICLGAEIYLSRIAGSLPRSFGFPLLACALAATVYGRVRIIAALVALSAAFYPAAAVIIGLSLAIVLLFLPARDRGDAQDWSARRRWFFLSATALAAALVLAPALVGAQRFGSVITPDQFEEFPEAGPGGRYDPTDRAPFPGFFDSLPQHLKDGFFGSGRPWSPRLHAFLDRRLYPKAAPQRLTVVVDIVVAVTLLGWFGLLLQRSEARRLLSVAMAALVGHVIARPIVPHFYLPERYVAYITPLLVATTVPVAVLGCFGLARTSSSWLPRFAMLGYSLAVLLAVGGRGHPSAGLTVRADPKQPVYTAIARLPKDALIAGWPAGIMDNVSYVTRRSAFITRETHQAFHAGYVEEMRRRMRALVDAYFAVSPEPLLRLKREFGVTHLLVRPAHLSGHPPQYFKPFDRWVATAASRGRSRGFEVLRQLDRATIFNRGGEVLLDLSKIDGAPAAR